MGNCSSEPSQPSKASGESTVISKVQKEKTVPRNVQLPDNYLRGYDSSQRNSTHKPLPPLTAVTASSLSFMQVDKSGKRYIAHASSRSIDYQSMVMEENWDLDSSRSSIPFGKPIEEVYEGIHDGRPLGYGISGMVRRCTHRESKVKYAVKSLDMSKCQTIEARQQLIDEIEIMAELDHPNIVRLEEVYESDEIIYLVEELCLGGELFDRLDEQPGYHYTEDKCVELVRQITSAVNYLHSKGIVHRDLKLENFLFTNHIESDPQMKMIDFGLSKHFSFDEILSRAVGTPYTVAPEVILGSYDERCDVWAIGVIAYLLLSGNAPFGGCNGSSDKLPIVRDNILGARYTFEPAYIWDYVSEDAKDFIRTLLVTDPEERPTAEECLKHRWLHIERGGGKEEITCALQCEKIIDVVKEIPILQKVKEIPFLDKVKELPFLKKDSK